MTFHPQPPLRWLQRYICVAKILNIYIYKVIFNMIYYILYTIILYNVYIYIKLELQTTIVKWMEIEAND